MQILVGSRRHDALQKAREWFAAASNVEVLTELVKWAVAQETQWGECGILVEPDIPGSDRTKASNVDLIVAFSGRVAVCEVKNHRSFKAAQAAFFSSLNQCSDSYDLVRYHLAASRAVSQDHLRPFLFLPNLNSAEVTELITQQLSKTSLRHVSITGGRHCQTVPAMPNGHPLYLPYAIQKRIGQLQQKDLALYPRDALVALLRLVDSPDSCRFDTLDQAIEYLRTEADKPRAVRLPVGHVKGLRDRQLREGLKILARRGVVELVGPFGIGKSAFARELMSAVEELSTRHLKIATCTVAPDATLGSLCRNLLTFFDIEASEFDDDRALLDTLIQCEGVVWIQSYAAPSSEYVKVILEEAQAASSRRRCQFIVESIIPLFPFIDSGPKSNWRWPECYLRVSGLDRSAMRKILVANAPIAGEHDLLSLRTFENPRLALARWRSEIEQSVSPELVREFAWVERVFRGLERDMLSYLACLLDTAPCGIGHDATITAAYEVFSSVSRASVRGALYNVFDHLRAGKMLDRAFTRSWSLKDFGVRGASALLHHMEPSLIVYVRDRLVASEFNELTRRTTGALETLRHRVKHVEIVLGFRRDDLQPFMASTLRNGMWGPLDIVEWLDRRPQFRFVSRSQAYLERHVHATQKLFRMAKAGKLRFKVDHQIGRPPDDFPLGHMLHAVLTSAAGLVDAADGLKKFSSDIDACENADILIEALCWLFDWTRIAGVLTRERLSDFLGVFKRLIDDCVTESVAVRLMVYRKVIFCVWMMGRGALSAYEPYLLDVFRVYFPLAASEDNFWFLVDVDDVYRKMRRLVQRELDRAIYRFEDDGNPNYLEARIRWERRCRPSIRSEANGRVEAQ